MRELPFGQVKGERHRPRKSRECERLPLRARREVGTPTFRSGLAHVGTDQRALDELVRGNASISAHFQRNVTSLLSRSDAAVVEEVTSHYDNYHHGLEHAAQAEALPDDFLRRFCVIGSPDTCTEGLYQLVDLGLSHLVILGGSRDIDVAV